MAQQPGRQRAAPVQYGQAGVRPLDDTWTKLGTLSPLGSRLDPLRQTPAQLPNTVTMRGKSYKGIDNGRAIVMVPTLDPGVSQAELTARRRGIERVSYMLDNPIAAGVYGVASAMGVSPQNRDLAMTTAASVDAVIGSAVPRTSQVRQPGRAGKAIPNVLKDGSVRYREANAAGQSQGMNVTLVTSMLGAGTGTMRSVRPPGFVSGKEPYNHDRAHLRAAQLGGHARELKEVFTGQRLPTNGKWMSGFESKVRRRVESGEIVDYAVTPLYSQGVAAPTAILLNASGDRGPSIAKVIGNRPKVRSDDD